MNENIKTRDDLIREFINKIECRLINNFDLNIIKQISNELNLKINSTNGLPFNGNTYEIFREININGYVLKEIIGHFKYVYSIYGNNVYFSVYDYNCVGGSHLNNDESCKFIYRKDFKRR